MPISRLKSLLFLLLALAALVPAPVAAAPAADARAQALVREIIEGRVKGQVAKSVEGFFANRLEPSSYTYTIDVRLSDARVNELLKSVKGVRNDSIISSFMARPDLDALSSKLNGASYESLQQYVDKTNVMVGFGDRIGEGKWKPWVDSLNSQLAAGNTARAAVVGRKVEQPVSEREHLLQREAQEARARALAEIAAKERSERRNIDHEYQLKNFEHEKVKDDLLKSLHDEKQSKESLAEQINNEKMGERVARDWPVLLKFMSIGGILGLLLIVALSALAIGLILAATGLGKRVVTASKEAGTAIQSAFGGQAMKTQHKLSLGDDIAKQVQEVKRAILAKDPEIKDDVDDIEPELLAELTKIVQELVILINRDLGTAAAQVTKLIEGHEQDKVMVLFDLLGEETAKRLYETVHPKHQRELQRYFFLVGPRSIPRPKLLYLLAVSFRSMLTATEVLIKTDTHKAFSRLLLVHSDQELANALRVLDPRKSSAMLAILPPQRVVTIMRAAETTAATAWRRSLPSAVKGEVALYVDDINRVEHAINAPDKVILDEATSYLKDLMSRLTDAEGEDILIGAEKDPRLKAAIGGLRASLEDLWAQPQVIMRRLLEDLELAPLAALLVEAPPAQRAEFMGNMLGRRKELLSDEVRILDDEKMRKQAVRNNSKVRRKVLERLADLADAGEATLPFTKLEKQPRKVA